MEGLRIMLGPRIVRGITDEEQAQEWESLSEDEKRLVANDILGRRCTVDFPNGVACSNEEVEILSLSDGMEKQKISLMNDVLDKIPSTDVGKSCYLQAVKQCPEVASSDKEKLHFLRCEDFNPVLAAHRLLIYWTKKVDIFGADRAYAKLSIKSLLPEDGKELHSGYLRLLPGVDLAGRGLLYMEQARLIRGQHKVDGMLRVLWYLIQSALENESVCLRGIVVVNCFTGVTHGNINQQLMSKFHDFLRNCLPVRIRAIHWCHPPTFSWWWPAVDRTYKVLVGRELRLRFLTHEGTTEGVLMQLKHFGLPGDQLPELLGGKVSLADFFHWIASRESAAKICADSDADGQRSAILSLVQGPTVTDEDHCREWEALPAHEKEDAIIDMRGTMASDIGELTTEANERRSLEMMDKELQRMPETDKLCFLEALRRCPETAASEERKIWFLKCEDFNAQLAARRLANYWTTKVDLFGSDRAFLPLTIASTLGDVDLELRSGFYRLLPGVDRAGRAIFYIEPGIMAKGPYSVKGLLRVLWYLMHAALENDSVQASGVVFVCSLVGASLEKVDRSFIAKEFDLYKCLPVRVRALHLYIPPFQEWWSPLAIGILKFVCGRRFRSRFVVHSGTMDSVRIQLGYFGILPNQLPTSMGGNVTTDEFLAWLSYRKDSKL